MRALPEFFDGVNPKKFKIQNILANLFSSFKKIKWSKIERWKVQNEEKKRWWKWRDDGKWIRRLSRRRWKYFGSLS